MSEMGLSEYCHDINQMNADTLISQFEALVGTLRSSSRRSRIVLRTPDAPWTSNTSSSSDARSNRRQPPKHWPRS